MSGALEKLQNLVSREWQKHLDSDGPHETRTLTLIGMAGEVGEICDNVKRFAYYGVELDRDNLLEEVGGR